MITGFNTDVEFQDRVFHVQTEDRGLATPVVDTLIYCGGEIVAQRVNPYDELVQGGKVSEDALLQRMESQHQEMIRAILNGKFESSAPKPFGHNIITNRSLDEVILDFLAEEAAPARIRVEWVAVQRLVEGERHQLRLRVVDDTTEQPIGGARVTVTLVSTEDDPAELATERTSSDGSLEFEVELPTMGHGDCAVVCEAGFGEARAELRQLVVKSKSPTAAS